MHVYSASNDERRIGVISVAWQINKPSDAKGTYRKACALLARDLGWKTAEVFDLWRHIALMREFEQRWPRGVAEWQAMHDTVACLTGSQGAEGN